MCCLVSLDNLPDLINMLFGVTLRYISSESGAFSTLFHKLLANVWTDVFERFCHPVSFELSQIWCKAEVGLQSFEQNLASHDEHRQPVNEIWPLELARLTTTSLCMPPHDIADQRERIDEIREKNMTKVVAITLDEKTTKSLLENYTKTFWKILNNIVHTTDQAWRIKYQPNI